MSEKTYNGWTNYETWCVKLWLDNEEGDYRYWRGRAQEIWDDSEPSGRWTRDEAAAFALADALKEELSEANPLGDQASLWSDLLGAALSEVNWDEMARAYIEDDVDKTVEIDD